MFYSPEVLIAQKKFRINLLRERNEVGNFRLINALKREIRVLEAKLNG